jgi:hypothetical protein
MRDLFGVQMNWSVVAGVELLEAGIDQELHKLIYLDGNRAVGGAN